MAYPVELAELERTLAEAQQKVERVQNLIRQAAAQRQSAEAAEQDAVIQYRDMQQQLEDLLARKIVPLRDFEQCRDFRDIQQDLAVEARNKRWKQDTRIKELQRELENARLEVGATLRRLGEWGNLLRLP